MSVWSECSGTACIQKDSGFSLRKFMLDLYDECTFREYEQQAREYDINIKFNFVFSLEGRGAAKLIQELVDHVRSLPGDNWIDVTANIRF